MRSSVTEHTILGIVWNDGPTTTYRVMRKLAASPSSFYRNRAATAYRVVQRLIEQGLLEVVGEDVGARGDRQIRITGEGLNVLRAWLLDPVPYAEVAHSADLIRLRLYSAGAIRPEERATLIDNAISELLRLQLAIEGDIRREGESGDEFAVLAAKGSLFETKARIAWLQEIRPRLLELGTN
jgi:DNA-binding PadR family transcriptional regulator